jgi:hypothetical protein
MGEVEVAQWIKKNGAGVRKDTGPQATDPYARMMGRSCFKGHFFAKASSAALAISEALAAALFVSRKAKFLKMFPPRV